MPARKTHENHGMHKDPLYKLWQNVKDRCRNPKNPYFHNYGGRGVTISQDLAESFLAFRAVVGERPSKDHTLDRINNDLPYQSGNLRWATKKEQANNQRKNVWMTLGGKTQTLAMWAEEIGLAPSALHYRINQGGMSHEEALTTPRRSGRRKAAIT